MKAPKILSVVLWILAITFAIPLMFYAAKGSLIRLSDDDYCYAGLVKELGFWKAQSISYEEIGYYNGNRYSLTLLMGLMSLLPSRAFGIVPGISILVFLAAITSIGYQLRAIARSGVEPALILVFAEALLFFTLYRAPNQDQVLFWVTGLATYLAPLILNTVLLGVLLYTYRQERLAPFWYILVALLAWIGGGFSETMATTEFLWLLVFFLFVLWERKTDRAHLILIGVALLGCILSVVILAVSPSIDKRLAEQWHPSLLAIAMRSARYSVDFLIGMTKSSYLPALVSVALAFMLGTLVGSAGVSRQPLRRFVAWLLLAAAVSFLLVFASIAPSVYAQNAYPGGRALLPAGYVVVLTGMALAWALGQRFANSLPAGDRYLILAALLLVAIYPLHATRSIYATIQGFAIWQSLWDLRDSQIRTLAQQGSMDLDVLKIDLNPYYDQDVINDLGPNANSLYNQCAAQYYGVHTITADIYPPGQ